MKGNRTMKIFITNLGKYCEGYLVGKWVKLPISDDKLDEVLKQIGINEYYEEYFISDCENDIIGLSDVIFIVGNEVFFVILIDTDLLKHLVKHFFADGELYPFPDEITLGVLS